MTLSLALFAQLAAVARAESGLDPLAIGDATAGRAHRPRNPAAAVAEATALLRRGHSLDLGVADAFEPCRNIAAGARVLAAGFDPKGGENGQQALVRALSRYNTGLPDRGVANGYVARVRAAAATVVPAIRLEGAVRPDPDGPAAPPATTALPEPPAWDVYAQARRARERALRTPPPAAPASHPPDRPPEDGDRR